MSKSQSFSASATSGMFWMSVSVLFTKGMLFIMQFVLGYMLSASDYSVFAVVSVALTFVAGLQNAGASKMLVQQQEKYQALVGEYTEFTLYMGLIGMGVLVALGFVFSKFYRNTELAYVIGLSAVSVPFTSLISIQGARLSIDLRFRAMCVIDFYVATVNVVVVLTAAYLGARFYSIGMGTVASAVLRFFLNRSISPPLSVNRVLTADRFWALLTAVKWLIITAFLTGLSQQGDYFVLGRAVSAESLGYYYFGFQLTANVGQLLAQGIGTTLFPIFTTMKNDRQALGRAFFRASSVVHFACSVLCLGLVGFVPWLMHFIWRGKWDMAIITAVAMALSLPMRMLSPLGTVTLDSFGKWRLRTALLVLDSCSMMLAALIGAAIADLTGASIAVALQRFISGMIDFSFAVRTVGGNAADILRFAARGFLPFWIPAIGLVIANHAHPLMDAGLLAGFFAALRTLLAVLLFATMVFVLDRSVIREIYTLLGKSLMKRRAAV